MTERQRVLLADDHGLIAEAFRELLELHYDVVGVAGDGRELVEAAATCDPDVILTDISMPGIDGLEATRKLRGSLPEVPVIVCTMHERAGHVKAAFEAGAAGYVVKSSSPQELFDALEQVLAGGRYVSPVVAGGLLDSLLAPERAVPDSPLTPREIEIAGLVARGLESAEIAERLCISDVTVRTHCQRALRKLGLRNRIELARYALAQGWAELAVSLD